MEKLIFNFDVAIIGGGVAGIAAALSSVRSNKNTILIESTYMVGGLATSGLVAFYLPIDDGEGHQISYGICEELFRLSISKGHEGLYPDAWLNGGSIEEKKKKRFDVQFNPHLFSLLCEQKLLSENVKILYGCVIRDVIVKNNKIVEIIGSSRTQDVVIRAASFVDCTGDASICEKANLNVKFSDHGNVLTNWYYYVKDGQYQIKMLGSCDYVYSDGKNHEWFEGVDCSQLSDVSCKAHSNILNDFLSSGNGTKEYALATISTIPELRMTRKLMGEYLMKKEENNKYQEHSLGLITSWLTSSLNYELPGESLFSYKITNLYVAGRCISVFDDSMWDITRAIPGCTVTGEASGYLAANFADNRNIDFNKAQNDLRKRGVKIHLKEIGL